MKPIISLAIVLLLGALLGATPAFGAGEPEGELGTDDHPILWAMAPEGDEPAAAVELTERIHELTGIVVHPVPAATELEVLEALAADPAGAHMAVLSAVPYVVAADRGSLEPALVGVRNGSSSYAAQIIAHSDSGAESPADLADLRFARPDAQSDSGWIVPSLMMRAAGLDPAELGATTDRGTHAAVIEAIYDQEADAGAVHLGGLEPLAAELEDLEERIVVLAESPAIPNEGVHFAPLVSEEHRDQIVNALLQLIETPEGNELIRRLYSWDALEQNTDSAYDTLRELINDAEIPINEIME